MVVPKVRIDTALEDSTQAQADIVLTRGIYWASDSTEGGFQELRTKQMGNIYFRAIMMADFSFVSEFRVAMYVLSAHPPGAPWALDTATLGQLCVCVSVCMNWLNHVCVRPGHTPTWKTRAFFLGDKFPST